MYDIMKKQQFGVEIEMVNIYREDAQKIVAGVLGTSRTGHEHSYDDHYVIDQQGRKWKCESDASLSGGIHSCELVTPILKYEDIETLQNIVRALAKAGAKTDLSCGIHVHVDGANHTPKSVTRLVNLFTGRQDLIYEALQIGCREQWCVPMNKELLDAMKPCTSKSSIEHIWYSNKNKVRGDQFYQGGIDHSHYNITRYHGVNLHAWFTKGTVEFRLFNSTLHAGKVKAYIQFCLAMSAWAIEGDENRITFKHTSSYTPQQKVTIFRNFLVNRLGLGGKEFHTCRLHMLAYLKQEAAEAQQTAA